jgi:hypothetical protein
VTAGSANQKLSGSELRAAEIGDLESGQTMETRFTRRKMLKTLAAAGGGAAGCGLLHVADRAALA